MKKAFLFFISLIISGVNIAQWQPTRGLYSGAVHSVIVSNNEIIAGTNFIYKSSDRGSTWNVSNNGISGSVTAIRSIVKAGTTLVAGTDAGVYYSSDNGNNWTQSAGTSGLNIWYMLQKGSNLFLSTSSNGVYKSTNNGISWSAVNTGITTPLLDMRCLAVKGTDLYAGTDGRGIYKSTDDGAHWNTVNTGLPGSYYSVVGLAVIGNNILAGTGGAGMYKSTNNGGQWNSINASGISSTDYIMGMGVNGATIYASTFTGNLFKTTDYTNWDAVAPGPYTPTRYETFFADSTDFYVGCWAAATGEQAYGIFMTPDDGITWKHIGITDYPVSVLEVSGSNILAGTNDITGNSARISLFKTTESDSIWSYNLGGFAGNNITAMKASGATMYLFNNQGSGNSLIYRSTNNGNNWASTGYGVLYNTFNSFAIAGTLVYATDEAYSTSYVYVSSDNGQSWISVNSGLPYAVHHAYCLVLKGTTLYLGTDNGVYKNTVGQNNWTASSSGLTNMYIKSLVVSGNDLYAGTQGGGIFKSTDNAGSWIDVSTGIPLFANIRGFAVSGSNVFAGTDNGVFLTTNGTSWVRQNTGLLDTTVTVLLATSNYLWAGTSAHGVWKRALSEMIGSTPATPGSITGNSSVCPGSSNTYSIAPVSGATSYTWTLPPGWSGTSTTTSITAVAGQSGTLSVTANNSFGSSPPRTFNVTVTPVNTSVTQNGLTLTANASGAGYIWINCSGNTAVPGAVYQSFTATVTGNYAVIVTQNGCSDTSACFLADTVCHNSITGSDLPYSGLNVMVFFDTVTQVPPGNPGVSRSWDYSNLQQHYAKYAIYRNTSTSGHASEFPASNIYTYGPGNLYGSLYGGLPVGTSSNGYVFWKSDNTGFLATGFRPDDGPYRGTNVMVNPPELLIGAPASYNDHFNNSARWEFPMNKVTSDIDTFFIRNITKTITADACGSITTPHGFYPNILRQHEYVINVDSVYMKSGGIMITSMEYARDTLNNYIFMANGIGYPVCIVHTGISNNILYTEYYAGEPYGVKDPEKGISLFSLYPNPSNGIITVDMTQSWIKGMYCIGLWSLQGQRLLWKQFSDDIVNLDLSRFEKGIYIIEIKYQNLTFRKKIILE